MKISEEQLKLADDVKKFAKDQSMDLNTLVSAMFFNKKSLKLTRIGYLLVRNILKEHIFELPTDFEFKSSHILYLDRNLKIPYYTTRKKISMFNFDQSAFELTMFGDLDTYVSAMKKAEKNEN